MLTLNGQITFKVSLPFQFLEIFQRGRLEEGPHTLAPGDFYLLSRLATTYVNDVTGEKMEQLG